MFLFLIIAMLPYEEERGVRGGIKIDTKNTDKRNTARRVFFY